MEARFERFAMYGWGVVAYNLLVIPHDPAIGSLIGLPHRLFLAIALLLVLGQLVWARRILPRRAAAWWAAHAAIFLILTAALVEAAPLLFQSIADINSVALPLWRSAHLKNSFLLLAALALVPWYASGAPAPRREPIRREGWLLFVGLLGTPLLGMTGGVTALGETQLLLTLRLIHPTFAVVIAFVLLLAAGVTAAQRPARATRELALLVAALVIGQLIVGLVDLLLGAPPAMQFVHLLVANALWIALVLLTAAALGLPRRELTPPSHRG